MGKISLILASLVLIGFAGGVLAQETELPDPGLTPDHPLYFLERIFEDIGLFFTIGDLKKAERLAKLAQERMAEAKVMAEKGKPEFVQKALARYEEHLEKARVRTERAKAKGLKIEEVSKMVAEATSKHFAVLDEVLERVPEEAKEAIARAKQVSMTGHKQALKFLAGENPEKAMEISLKAVKERLERARTKMRVGQVEKVKEAIREFEELDRFGEEISKVAKEVGLDVTKVEELVGKATSIHLEILSEVYEKVPEQAKEAIEKAMEVSAKGHHRAVESLKEALKEKPEILEEKLRKIPEEVPLPEEIPLEVRKRIQTQIKERPEVPPAIERPEEVEGIAPGRPETPPAMERLEVPRP